MALLLVKPPVMEPVSLADMKLHLRVDIDDDNALITSLITAAREFAEDYQSRQFIAATWDLLLDAFPPGGRPIVIPCPPLMSIASVGYVDTDGEEKTLTEDEDFEVDADTDPGRIRPVYGETWPSVRDQMNAVRIRFVTGYATVVTANATSNIITCTGDRALGDGYVVRFHTTDTLPAPLALNTDYYVRDAAGTAFKVALTDEGTAVDLTDTGTGTHTIGEVPSRVLQAIRLLVGHWYANRESVVTGTTATEIPFTVKALLSQRRYFA